MVVQSPPWNNVYASVNPNKRDANNESSAIDVAEKERQKELKTSSKWRNYEKDKKNWWASQKPAWVKRGRNTKELKGAL